MFFLGFPEINTVLKFSFHFQNQYLAFRKRQTKRHDRAMALSSALHEI
jgi:hypothetical protein